MKTKEIIEETKLRTEGLQMKTIKWMTGLLVCMLLTVMAMVRPSSAADAPAIEVGRVYYMEGDLLRYVPDENDWVSVVKDAPFGTEDTLFSGSQGMAELIVPNGSWIRVGNNTQIQFIALDTDMTEMDVASGVVRVYNKGSSTVIKATSPFGYVLADPGTVFDFYVGDNSVEVVAVKGTVSFVQSSTEAKYDVAAGSPSILADQDMVSSGEGTVDIAWDRWNATRESFWSAKSKARGRSVEYLPPNLMYEADALDENGMWERVSYEGADCWFWRPTTIIATWSPFTMGIWTEWDGDQTWIPAEPFGYVTHHYGNWVYTRHHWYWAPPVVSVRVGLPLLDIGFFWNPGRVSWIHSGVYVGWVPLAPRETYYSRRNWGGPHHEVVNDDNVMTININVRNYAYANRAVIVKQNNFHGVENYRNVRVNNINPTIINNYHAAPVVNNTVIKNYTTNKQRYNYTNATVTEKPHNAVINRIRQNETAIRQGKKENAAVLQQQVKNTRKGKVNGETRVEAPKATNYIVPANEVNRPKSEIKLQKREIKTKGGAAPGISPGVAGKPDQQPSQPGQSVAQPERVTPSKPSQQEKPAVQPDRVVVPSKSNQQEKPAVQPDRVVIPSKPSQQEKPAVQPDRVVVPAKQSQQETPAAQPDRVVVPAKSNQQEKPAVQPGRVVAPARRPSQQERSVTQPESAAPAKQSQQEKPAVQPDRVVVPSKASQQEKPAVQPGRVVVPAKQSQPETPAVQPEVVAPATPTEKGVDKSKKVETPESATKKDESKEKARQKKLKEMTNPSGNGTGEEPVE